MLHGTEVLKLGVYTFEVFVFPQGTLRSDALPWFQRARVEARRKKRITTSQQCNVCHSCVENRHAVEVRLSGLQARLQSFPRQTKPRIWCGLTTFLRYDYGHVWRAPTQGTRAEKPD